MTNKQFGLICKRISHILGNQEWIMRKLDQEDKHFYLTEDTNIGYTAFHSPETLRRRIVEVPTEEAFPYVISDSILKDKS